VHCANEMQRTITLALASLSPPPAVAAQRIAASQAALPLIRHFYSTHADT
jgi:hypothetical protein